MPKDSESKRSAHPQAAGSIPGVVANPDLKDPQVVLSLLETDQVVAANQEVAKGLDHLAGGVRSGVAGGEHDAC